MERAQSWKIPIRIYVLGFFIRILLVTSPYQKTIADRIEVSTPMNSWKRMSEALHLEKLSIYPYDGDFFHELPLNLKMHQILVSSFKNYAYLPFVLCDMITAFLLTVVTQKYLPIRKEVEKKEKCRYAKNIDAILIKEDNCLPITVAAAYLLNPYIILNCVGLSSTVFSNLLLAAFLDGLVSGNLIISTISLAMCISQNLYCVVLLSPLFLHFLIFKNHIKKAVISIVLLLIFWCLLLYFSYSIYNSWDFLSSTYGSALTIPDLRPNIGLFWYFFAEVFGHFQLFFLCSFQINSFLLYTVPLSIQFRRETLLLSVSLLFLAAIFKSYPCINDLGFILSMLPNFKHVLRYIHRGFPIFGLLIFGLCTVLAPTFWYLWLYNGNGNANFYFGVTLAFGVAQIVLLSKLLFAYVQREYELIHGIGKIMGGKSGKPVLS